MTGSNKKSKDKTKIKIEDLLKSHADGLTIKEMMDKTGLARHTLLARLHKLEGQDKLSVRQINMAKLHRWKHENEDKKETKPEDVKVTEIKEEHIKKPEQIEKKSLESPKPKMDMASIKSEIEQELKSGKISHPQAQMKQQREPIKQAVGEEKFTLGSWVPEMSVKEANIDKQHQKLILQVDKLKTKMHGENSLEVTRECIHFLDSYVKEHFTYEEAYMKKNKFPGLEEHKKVHGDFIKFYEDNKKKFALDLKKAEDGRELAREFAKKSYEFLGKWLINHILIDDHKYVEFISKVPKRTKEEVDKIIKKSGQTSTTTKEAKVKQKKVPKGNFVVTGVPGFDDLLEQGIPKGNSLLVAGGAGSGKTIFCLQTLAHHAAAGKKCLYMSFEESEDKLKEHMKDFGWPAEEYIKKGNLKVQRFNPFDITRNVDALLAQQKGELLIDIDPIIIPKDFKPDFIALDSLTAIASAFTGKEDSYRIYIEQLFRFFEKIGATSLLITETEQIPKIFSKTGVEEFLADGVIVFYNLKHGNVRENAIEILKLRGAAHQKKIVAMQITGSGVIVYPEQEVFSEIQNDLQR